MKIGVIGASLAGLVAGGKLARAGHDVTVIEKSREVGGKVRSFTNEDGMVFDHGLSFFTIGSPEFRAFVDDLEDKNLVAGWGNQFGFYDGTQLHPMNPNRYKKEYYAPVEGMNRVMRHLSRWVDLQLEEKAGGLTYIGANRTKKRSWMINLTDISVFECDAVIIAAPAPEAYGVLQIAQDEIAARKINRHIDEIRYDSSFSLMLQYDDMEQPDWKGIECEDSRIALIVNESSKRPDPDSLALTIHSTADFAGQYRDADPEDVQRLLLERVGEIVEARLANPDWSAWHYWKYNRAINPMDESFMELEMEEAPLALVGDYLGDGTFEDTYLSGYRLGEYWSEKYEVADTVL